MPLAELVEIGRAHGIVMIDDVGAGPLLDFSRFGFDKEPTLQESVQAGADLTTASADKLIGASQGGIILGRADLIQAVRQNPFARIVRVGKLTLAALEATLTLFLDEAQALARCPRCGCSAGAWRISPPRPSASPGRSAKGRPSVVTTAEGFSQMGSGSLPTQNLPTRLVAIQSESVEAGELACGSAATRRRSSPASTRARCWSTRARCWKARSKCWSRHASKHCGKVGLNS